MVVSQGAFAVMIFTDRYFMSLLSPTHMAASLGGGVASFFCMSLFIGILSYANALVAQYYGKKELEKCTRVVTQGLILCLGFIPTLLVIGYFVGSLFAFMGHTAELEILERKYFYILIFGSGIGLLKTCFASYFAGIAKTRAVMIADTLGVTINIPLTYALIFGVWQFPELGIEGAAYATIISSMVSLGIFMAFYFQRDHRRRYSVDQSLKLDRGILNRYMRLGVPSGIEMFLNVAAFNLFLLMFQSYGVVEAASAAIVFNWDIVSFVPMIGLNVAIISMVGRFVGENNLDRMREVMISGFLIGLVYSSILAILFVILREPLVAVFLVDSPHSEGILNLSTFMMIGLASYVMADAIILITGGILRGAGDTRWLMWVSILLHWLMLIIQYFVIKVLDMGPKTAWWVFVAMILVTALYYVFRLRGGKWRTPEALARVMAEQ
ncbi:MAG: MATE family efflux transporter [Gammaproteobacteria bacterium]|nr:MATE family efflux transporter [Gammaproteobacteria bacterium]MBT5205050.1 MATE family efflux transporter [Gammaproteobacteria bacterium]MBT5600917.1 MATE family efflux transporter [Gammaproteobacteria bacterium]MBT6244427.1 MATE family efflux transporter [Gammaproteobacteria bacterium]